MKTSRYLTTILGALLSVACIATETPKTRANTRALPKPPAYQPVATMQILDTMKGRKKFIDWTCFAAHDGTKPTERTTAWLQGKLKAKPGANPGVDLWDIGAQHRTATVKLRLVSKLGAILPLTQITDANGQPVAQQPSQDADGFYTINPSLPNAGIVPVNEYRIQSDEKNITVEVYFAAHPPPGFTPLMTTKQVEDGGPPAIPPVNEN